MKIYPRMLTFLAAAVLSASAFAADENTNTTAQQPSANVAPQTTPAAPGVDMGKKLENMTPEQRQALQQKRAEKWENLTPEQKQHIKDNMRKHWQAMTPEEKQAFRERTQMLTEVMQEDGNTAK